MSLSQSCPHSLTELILRSDMDLVCSSKRMSIISSSSSISNKNNEMKHKNTMVTIHRILHRHHHHHRHRHRHRPARVSR